MVAKGEIVIVQAEVFIEAGTGPCEVGESVGLKGNSALGPEPCARRKTFVTAQLKKRICVVTHRAALLFELSCHISRLTKKQLVLSACDFASS